MNWIFKPRHRLDLMGQAHERPFHALRFRAAADEVLPIERCTEAERAQWEEETAAKVGNAQRPRATSSISREAKGIVEALFGVDQKL